MTAPDPTACSRYLAETDEQLTRYIDETHRSYLELYLGRAHARHVLEEPAEAVVRELWLAARTLHEHAELNLAKWPPQRIKSRRILPMELALVTGDEDLVDHMADRVGMDLMPLLAGVARAVVAEEVQTLTSWFATRRMTDPTDLPGTLAVLYCTALTAILTEESESLRLSSASATAVTEEAAPMIRKVTPGLGRLIAVHRGIEAITGHAEGPFIEALAGHGRQHLRGLASVDPELAERGEGQLDISTLALLAIGAALNVTPRRLLEDERPELAQARRYAPFLWGASTHRREPTPEEIAERERQHELARQQASELLKGYNAAIRAARGDKS